MPLLMPLIEAGHTAWAWLHHNAEPVLALFTIALAVVTFLLVVYTRRLADDAKKTGDRQVRLARVSLRAALRANKIAADTAERQQRAYVFVDMVALVYRSLHAEPNGNNRVCATFNNHGATPAMIGEMRFCLLLDGEAKPVTTHKGGVAGSNDPKNVFFDQPLTESELEGVLRNGQQLRCLSTIEYEDILGRTRMTSAVWRYNTAPNVMAFIPDPDHRLNRRT